MWKKTTTGLAKEFKFLDFSSALEFVNKVGSLAEHQNHHPDIQLSWGKVIISIFSHDKQAITNKDYELAKSIDGL